LVTSEWSGRGELVLVEMQFTAERGTRIDGVKKCVLATQGNGCLAGACYSRHEVVSLTRRAPKNDKFLG
jgi:hypothetical protein